jgi:uncharacterized glyoxalase superfamily protein PhnB
MTNPLVFDYTVLYVSNVASTVAFYETAFGLSCRFLHEGGQYAEMETPGVTLAFAENALAETLAPGQFRYNDSAGLSPGMQISFSAQEVAAAYERALQAGAIPVAPPELKPWGFEVAFVKDLNGILVELCRKATA